jgi:hypothetical protein
MGDSKTAFAWALRAFKRNQQLKKGLRKVPPVTHCDKCGEVIDDKPKDGWFGFAATKEGYTYCGRCIITFSI